MQGCSDIGFCQFSPFLDMCVKLLMPFSVCKQGLYIRSLLTSLRDSKSDKTIFRRNAELLGDVLMMELIDRGLISLDTNVTVTTPTDAKISDGVRIVNNLKICIVPIIRAGLSFLNSAQRIFSTDYDIGHLVIQRDEETALPKFLLDKIPQQIAEYDCVMILDPMLATGGSVVSAIDCITAKGVEESKIVLVHALAAPEGVSFVTEKYPKINGVIGVVDEKLNDKKYIVPGLGDWGDRFY